MKVIKSRKGIALLAVLVVAAIASFGAYAYFTTTGSGDGTATVGTDTPLTITGTASAQLYPGGPAVSVPLSVTNTSASHEFVNTVTFTGATAYSDSGHTVLIPNGVGAGNCDLSQFSGSTALSEATDVAGGGATTALPNNASVSMANDTGNTQDACKGAYLLLHFTSN